MEEIDTGVHSGPHPDVIETARFQALDGDREHLKEATPSPKPLVRAGTDRKSASLF